VSESAGQPVQPPLRTWRPMAAGTAGILLALGLIWFVAAVVVPVWRACLVVDECAADMRFYSRSQPYDYSGAIKRLGGEENGRHAIDLYLRLMRPKANLRGVALYLLSRCGEKAVPRLLTSLRDPDRDVREKILWALQEAEIPADADLSPLVSVLDDEEEVLRSTAAYTLGRVAKGRSEPVAAMTALFDDPSDHVRFAAIRAIEMIGPKARAAIPALEKMLTDRSELNRTAAAEALKKIRGEEAKP